MNETGPSNEVIAKQGNAKILWAERHFRLLARLREEFAASRPFADLTIGVCLHIEPKSAVLCRVLQAGGAEAVITGSPGTTQDDVVVALRSAGFVVFGRRDDKIAGHHKNIRQVLERRPHLLLDNGADLVFGQLDEPGQSRVSGALKKQQPEQTACANSCSANFLFR